MDIITFIHKVKNINENTLPKAALNQDIEKITIENNLIKIKFKIDAKDLKKECDK